MKHYAIVNLNFKHFVLLKSFSEQVLQDFPEDKNFEIWINESDNQEELKSYLEKIDNVKTFTYIKARYIEHPVYDYKFAILGFCKKVELIIIFRIQSNNSSKALRLVDVLGDQSALPKYFSNFQTLLIKYEAEYIHFYTSREIDTNFIRGCVVQINQESTEVVPNYFEPFSDKNVFLDYCIKYLKPAYDERVLYLGDSDQDRPNIIIPKVNSL